MLLAKYDRLDVIEWAKGLNIDIIFQKRHLKCAAENKSYKCLEYLLNRLDNYSCSILKDVWKKKCTSLPPFEEYVEKNKNK